MLSETITCILLYALGIWIGRLIGLIERNGIKLENKELKRQIELLYRMANRKLAPVVHAHYIYFPEYETKRCSHCKIVFGDSLYEKYCPSCGALMDERMTQKQNENI